MALLDIQPVNEGHTLLIPAAHRPSPAVICLRAESLRALRSPQMGIVLAAVILRSAATKNLQSFPRRGGDTERGFSQFNSRRLNSCSPQFP